MGGREGGRGACWVGGSVGEKEGRKKERGKERSTRSYVSVLGVVVVVGR